MFPNRRTLWVAGAVVFGWAGMARAEAVNVEVWTIRATKNSQEISPRLRELAAQLKKSFAFTGYSLLKTQTKKAEEGKTAEFDLGGGYKAKITPRGRAGEQIKLEVVVTERKGEKEEKKLTTNISIAPGKFQLLGGWKFEGEDVLIVAVTGR